MAFTQCLLRSLPRKLNQTPTKLYFAGPTLGRSASALASLQAKEWRLSPPSVLFSTALRLSPTCVSKVSQNININHIKEFSVTPKNQAGHGLDHGKLWTAERAVSAALLGVMPAAFIFPSQALDTLLAVSLVMHNHWGIEAIVVDYIRPSIFGNILPKVSLGLLYGLSIVTLIGLFSLIFTGPGLVNLICMLWKL